MSDGNIVAARRRLGHAVARLVEERPGVYHDATVYAPSLYDCLISDLAGTQGETRQVAKSIAPIWIDAVQLATDIEVQTRRWNSQASHPPNRLRGLRDATWRPQDTDLVNTITTTVDGWCESIVNLLDPKARKYISAPCPSCGRAIVYHKDSGGDRVRQPALKWTVNVGFECQGCKAHWAPDQTLFFARLLGFDLPEGVLE